MNVHELAVAKPADGIELAETYSRINTPGDGEYHWVRGIPSPGYHPWVTSSRLFLAARQFCGGLLRYVVNDPPCPLEGWRRLTTTL